jgi:hypothetical protein
MTTTISRWSDVQAPTFSAAYDSALSLARMPVLRLVGSVMVAWRDIWVGALDLRFWCRCGAPS